MTTALQVLVMVDEVDEGLLWSARSPQLPGLLIGYGSFEELDRELTRIVPWGYGITDFTLDYTFDESAQPHYTEEFLRASP